jgi:hypothetical protein
MIPSIVINCTFALVLVAIVILFAGHRHSVGIRCGAIFAIIVFIIQLGVCFALLTVSAPPYLCVSINDIENITLRPLKFYMEYLILQS